MKLVAFLLLLAAPPGFVLEDQREKPHDSRAVFGGDRAVVLLAGAERDTGEAIQAWALRLPSAVKVYGIANLESLPFFVPRGAVRSGLAETAPKTPVLCDFEGDTYQALGLPDGLVSAVVYWRGERVGVVRGPVSADAVARVLALVRTATSAR